MLQFPKNYFQDEIRDGFHIEAMMKCVWAAQIEVLEVFRELCEKHNLTYFADWGTLLGAVRHKGFIPWDDDVDICMLRPDYERFVAIANAELPAGYHVHSEYSSDLYEQPFAIMVNDTTISYSPERLQKFHGCPFAVGLDIFPLDVLPEDKELEEKQCQLLSRLLYCVQKYQLKTEEIMGTLSDIERSCGIHFNRNKSIKNQLLHAFTVISDLYTNTDSPYMTHLVYHLGHKRYLRREWYQEVVWLPFENIMVPAPVDYSSALTALFAEDYMTPKQIFRPDYPFYQKQLRLLEEALVEGRMGEAIHVDTF